jgi:hypothetical protein
MLIPQAYEPGWTRLDDGIFNEVPFADVPRPASQINNVNAVSTTTTAITAATSSVRALMVANAKRRLLVIQNNSNATTAGDVPPTFFIAFGQQAAVGVGLGLPPGVGIVLDYACPIDSVYITIGPFSNAGGSVVIQGAAVEGVGVGQ